MRKLLTVVGCLVGLTAWIGCGGSHADRPTAKSASADRPSADSSPPTDRDAVATTSDAADEGGSFATEAEPPEAEPTSAEPTSAAEPSVAFGPPVPLESPELLATPPTPIPSSGTPAPPTARGNPLRTRTDFSAGAIRESHGMRSTLRPEAVEPPPFARRPLAAAAKRAAPPRMAAAVPASESSARHSTPEVPATRPQFLLGPSGDSASSTEPGPPRDAPPTAASTASPAHHDDVEDRLSFGPATPDQDRLVRVFYATDRRASHEQVGTMERLFGWLPGLSFGLFATLLGFLAYYRPGRRRLLIVGASLTGCVAGLLILRGPLASSLPRLGTSDVGVQFTGQRGRLSVGWCDVSVPTGHDPGELESPSILRLELRPDPLKHVVLRHVAQVDREPLFKAIRDQVQQSPQRDLFLFVHGYNVTFEDAARRTAQMAYDVQFEGAPIFFSWPSQGQLLKYMVDENNVAWSVPHLKEFLLEVVRQSDARSVNLVAHSMGNRALTAAIRDLEYELRRDETLFDEVVLAAPDIDADVFKRDIVPMLQRAARRTTLYASNHDQALLASKVVHGYPRAGDSGDGLVVMQGIETVDVSRVDLSLLGHSYYGSSALILEDIGQVLTESLPPDRRSGLRAAERGGLPYWVFRSDTAARSVEPAPVER